MNSRPIKPAKPELAIAALRPLSSYQCVYVVHAVVEKLIADRAVFLEAGNNEAVDAMEQLLGLFKMAANEAARV